MKKNFNLVTLVVVVMMVVLTACGNKAEQSNGTPTGSISTNKNNSANADNTITNTITDPDTEPGEETNNPEAEPTGTITEEEPSLTPDVNISTDISVTPSDVKENPVVVTPSNSEPTRMPGATATPTPIRNNAVPTKAPVITMVPTKAPTKIPTKAPTKEPTAVPTKAPTEKVCKHEHWDVIYVETVYPEEGHWEEQEAWDEPVYAEAYVCRCGMTELDFTEDGKTMNKTTMAAFLEHTRLAEHSYGTAYVVVEYIHHEATKVWVVDKLQQTSYKEIGVVCYDCGLKKYF